VISFAVTSADNSTLVPIIQVLRSCVLVKLADQKVDLYKNLHRSSNLLCFPQGALLCKTSEQIDCKPWTIRKHINPTRNDEARGEAALFIKLQTPFLRRLRWFWTAGYSTWTARISFHKCKSQDLGPGIMCTRLPQEARLLGDTRSSLLFQESLRPSLHVQGRFGKSRSSPGFACLRGTSDYNLSERCCLGFENASLRIAL
jgi:hypothetical protein